MEYKSKVKEFRLKQQLTQKTLADMVGVGQRHMSFIESGQKKPSLIIALKIGKIFKKDVSEIFFAK